MPWRRGTDRAYSVIPPVLLSSYRRCHCGRSISLGPATAEELCINASTNRLLEPGMVLATEVPCYIWEVNGFSIGDMVLIMEDGREVLAPKTLHYL